MALPREYTGQACSIVRALEIVGERWTLLIVRDAVFGVRRFSDFLEHLGTPRAVLTERLEFLVREEVMTRVPGPGKRSEYELTAKGLALWPVVRSLSAWGDEFYAPEGQPARLRARLLRRRGDPGGRVRHVRRAGAGRRDGDDPGPGAAAAVATGQPDHGGLGRAAAATAAGALRAPR